MMEHNGTMDHAASLNLAAIGVLTKDAQGAVAMARVQTTTARAEAWLETLAQVHAPDVAATWRSHLSALRSADADDWLQAAGGLSMENVRNELELLAMTDSAPSELLFGLAYGKLRDLLATSNTQASFAYPIVLPFGLRDPVVDLFYGRVLMRGDQLEGLSEAAAPEFYDHLPLGHSRDERQKLIEQAAAAPDAFMLGQLTSWLITHHRHHYPDLYPQAQAWYEQPQPAQSSPVVVAAGADVAGREMLT